MPGAGLLVSPAQVAGVRAAAHPLGVTPQQPLELALEPLEVLARPARGLPRTAPLAERLERDDERLAGLLLAHLSPTTSSLGSPAGLPERARGQARRPLRVLGRRESTAVDELDPVAVGVLHEADRVLLASAGMVRRLLRLDALLRQPRQQRAEVVDRQRDVAVAGAEVVRLVLADVDGQLQRVA